MAVVQHPTLKDMVHEVPSDQVKDWEKQGWTRVKVDDEQKVLADAERARLRSAIQA